MKELFPLITSLGAWNWLLLAALLLSFETVVPGFFLVWFGTAAVVVGIIAFTTDISWQWEILIFALFALVAVGISMTWFRPRDGDTDKPNLNQRGAQYIGKHYELTTTVENGRAKVRIGDTVWSVEGANMPEGAAPGTRIIITASKGASLIGEAYTK